MDKYQTIWRRFFAVIIDSVLLIVFTQLFSLLLSNQISLPTGAFAIQAFTLSTPVFYYIILHFYYGKTLGKMIMKVKVLDTFETKINLGQSIIRSLPQLIPVIFLVGFGTILSSSENSGESEKAFAASVIQYSYVALVFWNLADAIVALSTEKHRALHDYIAGTVVVKI